MISRSGPERRARAAAAAGRRPALRRGRCWLALAAWWYGSCLGCGPAPAVGSSGDAPHGADAAQDPPSDAPALLRVIVRLRPSPVAKAARDSVAPIRSGGSARATERRALVELLQSQGASQRRRLAARWQRLGAHRVRQLWAIHALALEAPPGLLAELRGSEDVERISPDLPIQLPAVESEPSPALAWGLEALRVTPAWEAGFAGQGAVIASLDTGIDLNHAALAPRFRAGAGSWFDPHALSASPVDDDGHGTQSLGVVLGSDEHGTLGVAPGARWIAAKIFDAERRASYGSIHEALQWLLDPDGDPETDDAPDVVQNAWALGAPGSCDLEFEEDLHRLAQAGISVLFGAGNAGPAAATDLPPANLDSVLSVGAVDASLRVDRQSSRGPNACSGAAYPSLVAPGVDVLTLDLTYGGLLPHARIMASGTSIAVGYAVGAFALLRGAFPDAPHRDLEATLLATARTLEPPASDAAAGAGAALIDVSAAFEHLRAGGGVPREGP